MRTARPLAAHRDFTIQEVRCRDDHRGWSAPEPTPPGFGLVLVRTGVFRRSGPGGEVVADRTMGYLSGPGTEERFAHPAGGDVCTAVRLTAALWRELAGDRPGAPVPGQFYVDARVDLAHRLLRRAAAGGDVDYAVAERLVRLLVGGARTTQVDPPDRRLEPADRRLVEAARAAVIAGHPAAAGLLPLARLLAVSPYRLSRVFQRELGVPLTRFRNRVRVGAALDRLEQGETSLGRLAAELGFADQAHLTRTVRSQLGHTPSGLRRLLPPGRPPLSSPA